MSLSRQSLLVAATVATLFVSLPFMGSTAPGPTVIFVDDDATLGGDGLSWDTAYRFLQDALADAAGVTEIRVAQGTYKPDQDEAGNVTLGDRQATFQFINGVALMGGFAGLGAPTPDDRDITSFETTLSGDLLGDDGPNFANNGENSFHVTTGSGTAVLDGFTITGGNANGSSTDNLGGGMFNNFSSPTVTNCTFSGNSAGALGFGGGMANLNSSNPTVTNCTFIGNSADFMGGGMLNQNESNPTVTNCTFIGNTSLFVVGGGMHNSNSSNPTVTDCTFIGNSADRGGGMSNAGSSPTVTNCTFSGNTATTFGGGMYNTQSSNQSRPTVTNCILWNDIPNEITEEAGAVTTVRYSNVQGGWPGTGNINADPLFVDPANDDYQLQSGSASIDAGNNWGTVGITDTDIDGIPRFADDPATTDTGCGVPVVVDMGAYEFQGNPATVKVGDIDGDGAVAVPDLLTLLAAWGPTGGGCQLADFDLDGIVGVPDLLILLANWG